MKLVTKIETRDGSLFGTEKEAFRHAEKLYGDQLLPIARQLANQKYTVVTDFIDKNIDAFQELRKRKADMKMEADNTQDD